MPHAAQLGGMAMLHLHAALRRRFRLIGLIEPLICPEFARSNLRFIPLRFGVRFGFVDGLPVAL